MSLLMRVPDGLNRFGTKIGVAAGIRREEQIRSQWLQLVAKPVIEWYAEAHFAAREDLANSKKDLSGLIARNSTELEALRRRGERDYIEFDIRKAKQPERVGDILLQLKNTDVKRQKFEVVINADDSNITKKDRTANEPIAFLVGRDRLRYEIVVNYVDKDRIRGYMSTPKDKVLSAEAPRR